MRANRIIPVLAVCLCLLAGLRGAECVEDVPVLVSTADDSISVRVDDAQVPEGGDSLNAGDSEVPLESDSLGLEAEGVLPAEPDSLGIEPEEMTSAGPDSLGLDAGDVPWARPDSVEAKEPQVRLDRAGIFPASGMVGSERITVIGTEDMHELSSVSPGDALFLDSGAGVTTRGSYGLPLSLSLRAGRPDEVVYLLDGIPVSDRQLEVFDLNWLPLAGMSGIEILKGGASSINGSGAVSGVVNIVPANAVTDVPLSQVDMWWGGFGSRSINLALRRSLAGGLGVLGAYENARCGGWVDDSSSEGEKIFGKFTTGLGSNRVLDVIGFRYEGDIGLPDSCPDLADTGPGKQKAKRELIAVTVRGGLETNYHINLYRLDISERSTFKGIYGSPTSQGLLNGIDLSFVRGLDGPTVTSYGLGAKTRELDSDRVGDTSSYDVQAFGHREMRWERWQLSGRLGVVKNSDFKVEVAPSLAAMVFAREGQTVFAEISRSFAFPGLTNLDRGEAGPEHSIGFELGTRIERDSWGARLALYWTHVNDMIAVRTDEACARLRSTDREADIKGLDATVDFTLPPWLEGLVSCTVRHSIDESGDDLEYQPSRRLAWRLRTGKEITRHIGTGLTFAGTWTSSVSAGNRFAACSGESDCRKDSSLPGSVSGFVLGHVSIDRARIFGKITNVFDDEVHAGWGQPVLPGRSYEIGFAWELID
ncbi:MAG: TonB-dependent receptor [Candidatus Eisenbacteria bacterium]